MTLDSTLAVEGDLRAEPKPRSARWRRRLLWLVSLGVIGTLWQGAISWHWVSRLVLAAPTDIYDAARQNGTQFLGQFGLTVVEVVVATAIVWVVSVSAGALIAMSSLMYDAFMPILYSLYGIPWIIVYPLFVVWFGLGPSSKIIYACFAIVPVTASTAAAVRSVDRRYVELAHAYGATRRQIVVRILIPASARGVVAAMRLGSALVIIGVLISQILGSTQGIGFLISYYRTLLDTGQVYLGILFAIVLAVGGTALLRQLERLFGPRG